MGNWDGIDCTYEMVHTYTYIRKWPIRKALKATGFLKIFAMCFSYLFLLKFKLSLHYADNGRHSDTSNTVRPETVLGLILDTGSHLKKRREVMKIFSTFAKVENGPKRSEVSCRERETESHVRIMRTRLVVTWIGSTSSLSNIKKGATRPVESTILF